MKNEYVKDSLLLVFLLAFLSGESFSSGNPYLLNEPVIQVTENDDECEPPVVTVDYENGMSTAVVSWEGPMPQEGWVLLYGDEGTVELSWFLSDPEGYENPEGKMERVYSSPHTIYVNMLHEGPKDVFVVADCGDGILSASEVANFEMGEKGEEVIGEGEDGTCEAPYYVSATQNNEHSVDLSWEPQNDELYHIAWGPEGFEMNENFFEDPGTGSVITSENPYLLEFPGPEAEEPHTVFIRRFCGENSFSEWALPACHAVTGLESQVGESEVVLSWVPTGDEIAWQVAYGPVGIDPDDESNPDLQINYTFQDPSFSMLLVDIQQGIDYEFYVRADCTGNGDFSDWSEPGFFTTEYIPCDPPENTNASHITHQSADITWTFSSGETQWQVVYGVAPLDEAEATSITVDDPSIILNGLESETTYELYVVSLCASGETAQGETLSFTTVEDDEVYCIPYILTGCTHSSEIDNLIIHGENDTHLNDLNTGCSDSNYENKTDMAVDLAPGSQYFTRVSAGNFGASANQIAIWIDFDDDGVFDESERVGESALVSIGFTDVEFTIPEGANPGQHRMRVMIAFNSYASNLTPCNDGESISSNGEVHDYTANILELENCNNAVAGTAQESFAICPGEALTISTAGASEPAIGLERRWQSSPAEEDDWTDLNNGLLPTSTIYGGIQQATDFRYVVTCEQSGENSISEILHVSMSNNCYCIPEANCIGGSLGGSQINNVSLMGESIDLDNETGGCVGDGFTNYTINFPPDLKQGETYSLSVTANNIDLNQDKLKAWIDFNGNKNFAESEAEIIMDFPDGFPNNTATSEFTVPIATEPGIYRMRVRLGISFLFSPEVTECSTLPFGSETEDYFVEVIPGDFPACNPPSNVTVEQDDSPTSATISWLPGGDETQWELVYGFSGLDPDDEEPLEVNDNPSVLISDLEPQTGYAVYVRSICENTMSEWTEVTTFTTGSVSIEDTDFKDFSYFPNPTDEKINLVSPTLIEEVTILNISGQKIWTVYPSAGRAELDVSQLSSGAYFIKVRLNEKSRVFKFIKR